MELNELVQEVKTGLESFKTDAQKSISEQKTAYETLKEQVEKLAKLDGIAKAEDIEQIKKDFTQLAVDMKEKGAAEPVTFKKSFGGAIDTVKDQLAGFSKKGTQKLDLSVELKDMDFDNFTAGALDILTSQTLPGVYVKPWSQLWLRNIFPNASTTSSTIKYLQEDETKNATDGAADIWDGSLPIADLLEKPDVGYNFKDATADVHWIAGIVRIKREMLDDISFLRSYIPQQLVYGKRGIFIRENTLILATMNTNSIAYDGAKTILIEKLADAIIGQMRDNYHNASYVLMNNRDLADLIFMKATGSGEYDLPKVVQLTGTGDITIAGVPVIGLPQFAKGTAFVVDSSQSLFVSRMQPEVRFFEEDRDNVPKNLITIRGEERATHLVFDPTSIIKVTTA
jgi:Phage capsid family.